MMRFGADDFFMIGIEEDQVGVRADGDGALARVKAKKFCGRGGDELNKTIWRKMLAVDAASVDKAEAVLNAGAAIEHRLNRSEEHTSELQSLTNLVCRLLLEKKKKTKQHNNTYTTTT